LHAELVQFGVRLFSFGADFLQVLFAVVGAFVFRFHDRGPCGEHSR
jgi:hypothetical protein